MRDLFAVCTPGLEPILRKELQSLELLEASKTGAENTSAEQSASIKGTGGVAFSGNLEAIYRANLQLRSATRILVRLGEFYAISFPELKRKAAQLPWDVFLARKQPVALRVTCHKSKLYHTGAVAQRMAEAIGNSLGAEPALHKFDENTEENPPQLIVVRIFRNQCTVSIDCSGAALYRRGYRLAGAKAPLRETLAASMLLASGWDRSGPLIDPFCGSGTIAIEAGLMAAQRLVIGNRRFAFMNWPSFDKQLWYPLKSELTEESKQPAPAIIASDRDAGAIKSAAENARRAGLGESISFIEQSVSAIEPAAEKGWIVTNPPYGVRLSADKDLRNLYAQFGNVLRQKCPGWRLTMLCGSDDLIRQTGIKFRKPYFLDNGGIKVKLVVGTVSEE